jgi:hypothetical protein
VSAARRTPGVLAAVAIVLAVAASVASCEDCSDGMARAGSTACPRTTATPTISPDAR